MPVVNICRLFCFTGAIPYPRGSFWCPDGGRRRTILGGFSRLSLRGVFVRFINGKRASAIGRLWDKDCWLDRLLTDEKIAE